MPVNSGYIVYTERKTASGAFVRNYAAHVSTKKEGERLQRVFHKNNPKEIYKVTPVATAKAKHIKV